MPLLLWWTQDRLSSYPLNPTGNWDEGRQSSPFLSNAMLHKWCSDQWSHNITGTHSQLDHACHTDHKPVWCYPLNYYAFSINSYFDVRKPTWEEYEDHNPMMKLMVEAPQWDPSALNSVAMYSVCLNIGDGLSSIQLYQGAKFFMSCVTL